MPKISHILILLSTGVTVFLVFSAIKSGVLYQYDVDELAHTQFVYLIAKGFMPYTSFHMIFTPLFYWFQIPLYNTLGFNFHTIYIMRLVMSGLFIVRIVFSFLFIKNIFGKKVALFFVPLLLLDPFTVFSGFQIRPDNLMVPLFVLGLLFLSYALKKRSNTLFFLSGLIFSLSSLVLIKIVPEIAVIIILFAVYSYKNKKQRDFLLFLSAFPIPWIFLFIYFALQGGLFDLFRNIFFYAFLNNQTILNVTPVTFYYHPNNYYLFGTMGLSLNWAYIYVIHTLAALGVCLILWEIKRNIRIFSADVLIRIITVAVCIVLTVWVFTVRGVFLQYFLPLSWLLALFSGVSLVYFLEFIEKKTSKGYVFLLLIYFVAFILFAFSSIKGNQARAGIGNEKIIKGHEDAWNFIQGNEATFPNELFRPPGYPLTYGTFIGDVNPYILRNWGKVEDHLEKKKAKYVFKDDYLWMYLDANTKKYIDKHYLPSSHSEILVRKD